MISEKLNTIEGKAAQIVLARILDIVPNADGVVQLTSEDVDALQAYVVEAAALNPTNEDAIASGVLLVTSAAEASDNDKFKSFASKVSQAWGVVSDESLGTLEKITQAIGILFQSKKRAISKL